MNELPEHLSYLSSTYQMLKKTYPNFDVGSDYFMVIKLLYEEMSDRNLALIIDIFSTKESYEIINDIYKAYDMNIDCSDVKIKLKKNGYDDWLTEEN